MELKRRHAHNRKRILIHLNNTAHHARIIVKMAVPIRVGEHDVRSAVRAILIAGVEQTAKIRGENQIARPFPRRPFYEDGNSF